VYTAVWIVDDVRSATAKCVGTVAATLFECHARRHAIGVIGIQLIGKKRVADFIAAHLEEQIAESFTLGVVLNARSTTRTRAQAAL
jgi:hypothetical protein